MNIPQGIIASALGWPDAAVIIAMIVVLGFVCYMLLRRD
jgi:hypothetical protein